MNIFMTGAGGFIGKHLKKRLETTHRLHTPDREFFEKTSDQGLSQFMREQEIDVVIHLATHFVRKHTCSDVAPIIDSNILLGSRILEALKDYPKTWFINTGTALEHTGPDYDRPHNFYASTKASFQSILKSYSLPHVTLKLFETYGPEDNRDKILNLIHRSARTKETLPLTPGEQELEMAYIDDVIDAYERILELLSSPELIRNKTFAVAGTRVSLQDLVGVYEKETGSQVPVHWGAIPYRDNEIMKPWSDFASVPGLGPRVSLERGIQKTFVITS